MRLIQSRSLVHRSRGILSKSAPRPCRGVCRGVSSDTIRWDNTCAVTAHSCLNNIILFTTTIGFATLEFKQFDISAPCFARAFRFGEMICLPVGYKFKRCASVSAEKHEICVCY